MHKTSKKFEKERGRHDTQIPSYLPYLYKLRAAWHAYIPLLTIPLQIRGRHDTHIPRYLPYLYKTEGGMTRIYPATFHAFKNLTTALHAYTTLPSLDKQTRFALRHEPTSHVLALVFEVLGECEVQLIRQRESSHVRDWELCHLRGREPQQTTLPMSATPVLHWICMYVSNSDNCAREVLTIKESANAKCV